MTREMFRFGASFLCWITAVYLHILVQDITEILKNNLFYCRIILEATDVSIIWMALKTYLVDFLNDIHAYKCYFLHLVKI